MHATLTGRSVFILQHGSRELISPNVKKFKRTYVSHDPRLTTHDPVKLVGRGLAGGISARLISLEMLIESLLRRVMSLRRLSFAHI